MSGNPITLRPGFLAVCAVIRNGSSGALLLTDATGGAHAVAAGTTQTVYFPASDMLTAQSIARATGDGEIQLSDSYLPTNQNPSQQQPPGTVTANDANTQALLAAIQALLGTTNTNTGNTNSNVASLATLINATNSLDTDIKTLMTTLNNGLLPSTVDTFVLSMNGGTHNTSVTHAIDTFTIIPFINSYGYLTLSWIEPGGNEIPVITQRAFTYFLRPPEMTFRDKMPSGSTIRTKWEYGQSGFDSVFAIKY